MATDEEEEWIASRNKIRKRNKRRRQLLAHQQQNNCTYPGKEHLYHKHNKSQTTAVYQLTKVKLHLQKKTIAMNIKSRIGKGVKLRERVMEGNERDNDGRENLQLSRIYWKHHKKIYIKNSI